MARQRRANPKLEALLTVETVPYQPGRRIASFTAKDVVILAINARF